MTDIIRQDTNDDPYFDDILWERPETKKLKGSLMIVGGSPHGFASVGNAYEYSVQADAGSVGIVMPDSTKSVMSDVSDTAHFLPSTIGGSFSKKGLGHLKQISLDAWVTLLIGDFGRNSETSLFVEGFLVSTTGKIAMSKDAIDFASTSYPRQILNRTDTLLVCSLSQLQKILKNIGAQKNVTFNMSLSALCEFLAELSAQHNAYIITAHHSHCIVAINGRISVTPLGFEEGLWQTKVASYASVYWMQHQEKPFEAITTALHQTFQPQD